PGRARWPDRCARCAMCSRRSRRDSMAPARLRSRWRRSSMRRSRARRRRGPTLSGVSWPRLARGWGRSGLPDAARARVGAGERRIEERHKRETRRTRIDLLIEGVTAIESVYRDALAAPAPSLNADPPHVAPRAAAAALDACREAREAFPINEKGIVRLTYLL